MRPLLGELAIPTLVRQQVHARDVPPDSAREMAANIPAAELHMLDWENPYPVADPELDESTEMIRSFLARAVGREASATSGTRAGFQTILFTDLEASTPLTQRLIAEDDDLFGLSVTLAARIGDWGEPG